MYGSRDGSVGIARVCRLKSRRFVLGRDKVFVFIDTDRGRLRPTQSHMQWIQKTPSQRIEWSGREAYVSLSSSADIKNGETGYLLEGREIVVQVPI
jgi:hypothetical protein